MEWHSEGIFGAHMVLGQPIPPMPFKSIHPLLRRMASSSSSSSSSSAPSFSIQTILGPHFDAKNLAANQPALNVACKDYFSAQMLATQTPQTPEDMLNTFGRGAESLTFCCDRRPIPPCPLAFQPSPPQLPSPFLQLSKIWGHFPLAAFGFQIDDTSTFGRGTGECWGDPVEAEGNNASPASECQEPDEAEDACTMVGCTGQRQTVNGKRTGHPYQSRQPPSQKKPRTSFTKAQVSILEHRFAEQKYLASAERAQLALQLGMEDCQVKTWFQNRRTKWRRQEAEDREMKKNNKMHV